MGGDAFYYGLNAKSGNMIMLDRKNARSPNGLVFGTPGGGKSFSCKREMVSVILKTGDHVIVCDPEGEYAPLVKLLHGQIIRLSPTSTDYVNPLDINLNYSEDENPLALKSDFVLSFCELIMGGIDTILCGDCLSVLKTLPDDSIHCCVTSPPYYGLRDYGMDAQIGREDTPEEYIARLTAVFREVMRVLRPDGTLWLNIADSYCGTSGKGTARDPKYPNGRNGQIVSLSRMVQGCKPKDMIGIPWMLAFSLRGAGWYLRNDIIWAKGNPMPESIKDRCTRSHEHIFLFSKSKRYFYDWQAMLI